MAFCSRCGISIEGRYCTACGYDNQPQEKHQTVEDTVGQLYALRAGISLVSVQIDTTKSKKEQGERQINNQQYKIDKNQKTIIENEGKIKDYKFSIARSEREKQSNKLEELNTKKDQLNEAIQKEKNTVKTKNIMGLVFIFLGVVIVIPGIIAAVAFIGTLLLTFVAEIIKLFSFTAPEDPWGYIMIAVAVLCGGGGVGLIMSGNSMRKAVPSQNFDKDYQNCLRDINNTKSFYSACDSYRQKIPTLTEKIEEMTIVNEELIKELSEKKDNHRKEINYYNKCANETYNALVKEYSSILDTRDWENLDLVIYYLETGRAISVREALQLVDRQHQTDAIVESLRRATEQISETIMLSTQRIQQTIIGCTEIVSKQLIEVCGRMNAIEVNQEIANNYLRNISSEVAMNNAMLKKAKTSSEEMMRDIKQMRIYADNREIKLRNS